MLNRAGQPGVERRQQLVALSCVKLLSCVSQPPRLTVTNRTPASTSRVASRQLCRTAFAPNGSAIAAFSLLMSNAVRARGELMMSWACWVNRSSP